MDALDAMDAGTRGMVDTRRLDATEPGQRFGCYLGLRYSFAVLDDRTRPVMTHHSSEPTLSSLMPDVARHRPTQRRADSQPPNAPPPVIAPLEPILDRPVALLT